MNRELIRKAEGEMARGLAKWGEVDDSPERFLSAATEELGEVAHAINHNEGLERVRQEIAEVVGVLARLYDIVEVYVAPAPIVVSLERILTRALEHFEVSRLELLGNGRKESLVLARQVTMYLMRQETELSLREVGEVLHRNPATVSYAYGKVSGMLREDTDLRREILRLQGSLRRR